MNRKFKPVIKWSGSKRYIAQDIVKYFPMEIDTYYEPFCGGCSVLRELLDSNIQVNNIVCSDLNNNLIELWQVIKCDPISLVQTYEEFWNELNFDENIDRKKEFYNKIRKRFNEEQSPLDFFFLNRTCYNGLIRYNSEGKFNSPFHLNRKGIDPKKIHKIIYEWNEILCSNSVIFKTQSYDKIDVNKNDFIYLDPPYANTNGMYFNDFNNEKFLNWLRNINCGYILSYDGISGSDKKTVDIPSELYNEHVYLKSGNSSFKRLKQTDNDCVVYESLYIKNKK